MHILRLLLYSKLKVILSLVFDRSASGRIRNISMALFLLLMVYASYVFFHDLIFRYVINLEDIGFLLIERLLSTGFLIFFFMLIVSSFVTALATLFRSSETEYLFSTPVSERDVFTGKYFDILILSSWAILVMALPILYSYAKIRDFGTSEYALTGIVVLLPFVIIATTLGTLLALVATYVSKRVSVKRQVFGGVLVFALLLYAVVRFSRPNEMVIPFTEDFRALNIFMNNFRMNSHPLTPNFWLVQCLRSLVHDNYPDFFLYGAALISSAFFSLAVLYTVADRIFFETWLTSNEDSQTKKGRERGNMVPGISLLSRPTNNQVLALINKDMLVFIRDPGQWTQLFLLLALLTMYFINLRFIPKTIEIEQWRTIISLMNFVFCGLVLATLAVRFVYPSYSLEGDSLWVLGSSPVSPLTLFREKFWMSFVPFVVITEVIAFVSGAMLRLEGLYYILTIGGIFLMSLALSCLSIGLGAAYPYFSERDPSRIASSPGGILTIVCSLFYIAVMTVFVAVPCYRYTDYLVIGGAFPKSAVAYSVIGACVLNVITITVPILLGTRALKTREY